MKILLLLIAFCAIQSTYAQNIIKESFSANQIQSIIVNTEYADIEIESYVGNEIIIEASVNINLNMDNDGFLLNTSKSGNVINISSKIDYESIPKRVILTDKEGNTTILLSDDKSLKDIDMTDGTYNSMNYGYQTDITIKVLVPDHRDIYVESIYGDLLTSGNYKNINADITYGNIEVKQTQVATSSNIKLESTYGFVDYTIPRSSDIEFNLSTSYGEIFSDLDVVSSNKNIFSGKSCGTERGGKYTLNEAKSIAYITATYDDIYLRGK